MSRKKKNASLGRNITPKESNYKYNLNHDHESATTLIYPPESEGDNKLYRLPYDLHSLEPHITHRTLFHHYNDHHLSYYRKLQIFYNKHSEFSDKSLETLINLKSDDPEIQKGIINATLTRNHNTYWQSLKPKGGILSPEKSKLTEEIIKTFGSISNFRKKFISMSLKIGIGWIWLFKTENGLKIGRTDYHRMNIPKHYIPLFTIDSWEHAYYVDYGSFMHKYIENILKYLVNWDYAEAIYLKN